MGFYTNFTPFFRLRKDSSPTPSPGTFPPALSGRSCCNFLDPDLKSRGADPLNGLRTAHWKKNLIPCFLPILFAASLVPMLHIGLYAPSSADETTASVLSPTRPFSRGLRMEIDPQNHAQILQGLAGSLFRRDPVLRQDYGDSPGRNIRTGKKGDARRRLLFTPPKLTPVSRWCPPWCQ